MYDVIVVGARCAGSPTAMLLARKGYRVLCLDKTALPGSALSSHFILPPGVARLRAWGLLDPVLRSRCPALHQFSVDLGPVHLAGAPRPCQGAAETFCLPRAVLDQILLDAAAGAGVEMRPICSLQGLLFQDGRVTGIRACSDSGALFCEKARLVVGADGMHSAVSRFVQAGEYKLVEPLTCSFESFWSDLPLDRTELFLRPSRFWVAAPTRDGLTMIRVIEPRHEFRQFRSNVEASMFAAFSLAPAFAESVRAAKREGPFAGAADSTSYFRHPYGPGWALVGDAGCHQDAITAQGITDAFRDADLLAHAIDAGWSGRETLEQALADYHQQRDAAAIPMHELTCDLARLNPLSSERLAWLRALAECPCHIANFLGSLAGTFPVKAFYSPKNLRGILRQARRKKSADYPASSQADNSTFSRSKGSPTTFE